MRFRIERTRVIHHRTKLYKDRSNRRSSFRAADKTPARDADPRRTPHGEIFVAGSIVHESGIYEVLHDLNHRTAHEVVMIAEDLFPACDVCENRVRYRVLRTAPYIFSDEDFEEPGS
jgi:hypothetical protein